MRSQLQFIYEALTKILLDRIRPTADPHVQSAGRLACTVESLANASRDEVERRVALPTPSRGARYVMAIT